MLYYTTSFHPPPMLLFNGMNERENPNERQLNLTRLTSPEANRTMSTTTRDRWMLAGGFTVGISTALLLTIFGVPPVYASVAALPASFIGGQVTRYFISQQD